MACTVPVIRWDRNTSSDKLCRCARCTACGNKGGGFPIQTDIFPN